MILLFGGNNFSENCRHRFLTFPVENREVFLLHGSSVSIMRESIGYLYGRKTDKTGYKYRMINGIINTSGEKSFLRRIYWKKTLISFIAQLYGQGWKIEIFFKYIKQHLNVSLLISRKENRTKIMIYMTMILKTLIIVYKKKNNIKGFKIAKLKFGIELENEIIKEIAVL